MKTSAAIVFITTAVLSGTLQADALTNYERDKAGQSREKSWEAVDLNTAPITVQNLTTETSGAKQPVDEANAASGPDVYQRLQTDADFAAMKNRTNLQDQAFDKYAGRVDALEGLERHWEPIVGGAGGWNLISTTPSGTWTPAISNQTSDFTQTQALIKTYQRLVEEKERNIATGEVRTVNSYYESRPENASSELLGTKASELRRPT